MKFDGERIIPDEPELNNLYQIHMATYRFFSKYIQNKSVLDIGCGCGYGSHYLAVNGAEKVVGIDKDDDSLKYAQKQYDNDNLSYQKLDIFDLYTEFDQSFQAITSFQVLEHMEEPQKYLSILEGLLSPEGIISISTPNRLVYSPNKKKPSNPYHHKEYSPAELVELLSVYFQDLEIFGQKITNDEYQKYEDKLRNRVHIVPHWLRKTIPTFLTAPIVKKLKGRNPVNLDSKDIVFSDKNLDDAPILIAIGWKKKN